MLPRTVRTFLAAAAAPALVITMAALAGPAAGAPATDVHPATTAFAADFSGPAGSGVDASKWQHEIGNGSGGWGNHEREYYTPGTDNAQLDGNGHLVITARKGNPGGYQCWYGSCRYTSAKLSTPTTFTQAYGHVEARMKLPSGQGMWPAFWMLGSNISDVGWPNCGEIDVMENIGAEPSTVHGTIHGPGYSGSNGIGGAYTLPGGQRFAGGFHTFAIDWSPDKIVFSVDGNAYETRTPADVGGNPWAFNHSFYLILNLAVGGYWPGDPDGSTTFPQQLVVDYVHVSAG